MAKHALIPHPDSAAPAYAVGAKLSLLGRDVLAIEYALTGALDTIVIPARTIPLRRDELWRTTCFEAFARGPGGDYVEFNFAPSGEWACYRFEAYRSGMQPAMDLRAPMTFPERTTDLRFGLTAFVELRPQLAGATHLGLSAVIEEVDGTKSFWALAHPPGKPDFHHPDGFMLELPAVG